MRVDSKGRGIQDESRGSLRGATQSKRAERLMRKQEYDRRFGRRRNERACSKSAQRGWQRPWPHHPTCLSNGARERMSQPIKLTFQGSTRAKLSPLKQVCRLLQRTQPACKSQPSWTFHDFQLSSGGAPKLLIVPNHINFRLNFQADSARR